MKAAIVYRSRTGKTRRLAEQIGAQLGTLGVPSVVSSVGEADPAAVAGADVVLLGCWTNGLMVIAQHPDQPWIEFAHALPPLTGKKVGFFTTYAILTGSMFAKMRQELTDRASPIGLELKSRDGTLSAADRSALARFVAVGAS